MSEVAITCLCSFAVGYVFAWTLHKVVHPKPKRPPPTGFDIREEEIHQLERMYYGEKRKGEGNEE